MKKWTFAVGVALVALMTACSSGVDTTTDGLSDIKSAPTTGTSGNSLTLVQLTPTSGSLYIGDKVTFTVATNVADKVWVRVECYQVSKLVYSQTNGFFPGYEFSQVYTLGPTQLWTSGSASCKADLITNTSRKIRIYASTSFTVSGR